MAGDNEDSRLVHELVAPAGDARFLRYTAGCSRHFQA
jgi:hypothetical protein